MKMLDSSYQTASVGGKIIMWQKCDRLNFRGLKKGFKLKPETL